MLTVRSVDVGETIERCALTALMIIKGAGALLQP